MAIATITLTDEDLDLGRFKAELEVEGSQIDDGFMTAAHLTAVFIVKSLNTPEFREQVLTFANAIANEPGCSIGNGHLFDNDAPPMGSGEIAA